MKKLLLVLVGIALISGLMAKVDFYGQVRTGAWYYKTDENWTGGKTFDLTSKLYGNSRVGAKFAKDKLSAKIELGLKNNDAVLRLAYAKYKFDSFSIIFGQDYTGFPSKNLTSQANAVFGGSDLLGVGYGAAFDGRQAQFKFAMDNGFYFILMQPNKVDPQGNGAAIDALLPKMNFGFNYKSDSFSLFPTFGVNYSKYNKDKAHMDDAVLAYAFATTFVFKADMLNLKAQVNYGQNTKDYGIKGNIVKSSASWDTQNNKVINSTTYGGYLQATLKTDIAKFTLGGTYISNKNDNLNEPDTAASAFVQANVKISKKLCVVPEAGKLMKMEDGNGNKQGSSIYFGTKLQAKF